MTRADPGERARRRRAWQLLLTLARTHRHILAAAIIAGVGWQVAGIVVPLVIGWTIDHGVTESDRAAVWWGGLAIIVLGAFEAACAAVRHRMACTAYMYASSDLREALTDAALDLTYDDRDRYPPGEVLARATSDVDTVAGLLDAVGHTVAETFSVPIILVALFLIDPSLALVVGVTVPITAFVVWRYAIVWERRSEQVQVSMGETVRDAQETVEGFKTLRGIGAESAAVRRFEHRSTTLRNRSIHLARLWLVFEPALDALAVLPVGAVLWIGGNRVIDGTVSLGQVVTAVGFVLFLSGPVRTIGERLLTVQSALASAHRVVEVVDAPPRDRTTGDDPMPGTIGLSLEAVDLTIGRFGTGSGLLIERCNVDLRPGTTTVLEGPTGSGKTTLLAVLAGLRQPLSGQVRLGGRALDAWPFDVVRQRILLVGPVPFVFSGTVSDNLRFAAANATDADLMNALTAAQAASFVDELPAGLDSIIGERGVTLSGGQRQRLALARAVLAQPSVLLIDGATSALDPATEVAAVDAIRRALPDTTILLVTTNTALVDQAPSRLRVSDGHLAAS